MAEEKKGFKDTVNLPKTDFPIRAGLKNIEPELLEKWENDRLIDAIDEKNKDSDTSFTLHDGPPYPNGPIHMGHAMNKVLKDIIVRYQQRLGKRSVYIPGWDCHGLPIETQVIKELKANNEEEKKNDIAWFRNRCKEFALSYVDQQSEDFQRLGIFARWETPYLTLNHDYEAATIEQFGKMAENGLIFKGRKPIHWCTESETALAEAEIEYHDHRSPSIYVTFVVDKPSETLERFVEDDVPMSLLVWTTTPWTLPANVAVAAHPDFTYVLLRTESEVLIVVDALQASITELLELGDVQVIGKISGSELMNTEVKHPFINRTAPVLTANFVTKDDGTGFVHIAPGHGQDDYLVALEYDLPIIMPVDDKGRFTDEVEWAGKHVFDANKDIGMRMEANGTLRKLKFIKHSYPHSWRSKAPVIFRATEQWFVGMDREMTNDGETLREKGLAAIKQAQWIPTWGEKRITPMIENRPDWCISRQRYWGIPIPVFTCKDCGHSEMTGAFNKAVVDLVAKEGTLAWFEKDANDILPEGLICSHCGARHFEKERDILDVWFESGASFASVPQGNDDLDFPADLYLEGSDQHRGWFQSSLLIGLGAQNQTPYRSVLTHGFLVDNNGRKMSKSEGNVISPQEVIDDYGADILRWWIASSDFRNDVSISKDILNQARDGYSKVRNTIRFCLSNLFDFSAEDDALAYGDLHEIDRWILGRLKGLIDTVNTHYENYEFHLVVQQLHQFCVVDLSAYYLDMVKDCLYCDATTGPTRRSTQTAIYSIVDTLIKLSAPILVFTSEDAYRHFNAANKESSVHLSHNPVAPDEWNDTELEAKWQRLLTIRDAAYQQLEQLRNNKTVKSFLEAKVDIRLAEAVDFSNWESFLIVSQVTVSVDASLGDTPFEISVAKLDGEKCQRCWKVKTELDKDGLCQRCASVVRPERIWVQ